MGRRLPTEKAAKAARDEARVAARRRDYVDRSALTVTSYLREWQVSHSVAVKPKTMAGYRDLAERYVIPRIGGMRLQAVRPGTLSRLYRDLVTRTRASRSRSTRRSFASRAGGAEVFADAIERA